MTLNLMKLAVGVETLEDLPAIQQMRRSEHGRYGFYTRNQPKRVDELLDGGSIYWVIKGLFRAREVLKEFHPMVGESGRSYVVVEYIPEIIPVVPRQCRPFQGWRYLKSEDAPADLIKDQIGEDGLPPALAEELRSLGLIK